MPVPGDSLETWKAAPVSTWGTTTYGDPCAGCGFRWRTAPEDAVDVVAPMPDRYEAMLRGRKGSERHPDLAWSATGYVCHVADNLRIWSERLVAASAAPGPVRVQPYDPDLLAAARGYTFLPLAGALWSLRRCVEGWLEATRYAIEHDGHLWHPDRGDLSPEDVIRTNAHDASHHYWDIQRTLAVT